MGLEENRNLNIQLKENLCFSRAHYSYFTFDP